MRGVRRRVISILQSLRKGDAVDFIVTQPHSFPLPDDKKWMVFKTFPLIFPHLTDLGIFALQSYTSPTYDKVPGSDNKAYQHDSVL